MVQSPPRDAVQRPGRRPSRGAAGFLRDLVVIVVVAVLASFLIKTFLIRSFFIPSESMQNTLQVGDRILVNELVPGLVPLQRGDVVVFSDPGGWLEGDQPVAAPAGPVAAAGDWLLSLVGLSNQDANNHLVKRVIGLPGDHVVCCNALGQMSVNGVPVVEPYAVLHPGSRAVSGTPFDVTVPKGRLWVMGDNRYDSKDSRYQTDTPSKGFVPISDVVGRAFVVSWPVSHWSWLSDYPGTFDGVKSGGG
ncbi:signal peptidase I [Amnibacterium kyonggiense]|uniref:Signal peptidase I n=1 Tax=Amnibacterium kyonggiense TaxID=595671 RepID=A0A4R7FSY2_9MICO|nr:signal peptidase I [Amnibacterium kyonggiense]TDS80960.1 signal peptidase I [Amnibacterium kyonggiense]